MFKKIIFTLLIIVLPLSSSELSNYLIQDDKKELSDVKKMVKNGANPNGDENDLELIGGVPLYCAAGINRIDIVKYLISVGADVNSHGYGSALNVACYKNNYEIVKLLLEKGADPYRRNQFGSGFDSFYLAKENVKITKLLNKYKVKEKLTYLEEKAEMERLKNTEYDIDVSFKYYKNLVQAKKASKKFNKPIVLIVGRNNCRFCLILKKTALSDKKVLQSIENDFILLVLDVNKGIPNEYESLGVPATWFLKQNGEPMFQPLVGTFEIEYFLKTLVIVKEEFDKTKPQ